MEQVIRSGKVLRFKPSFSLQPLFIDRYLELTDSTLLYYQKAPTGDKVKDPLFRIPVSQIKGAYQIELEN